MKSLQSTDPRLKVTLGDGVSNAKNLHGTKETIETHTLVCIYKGEIKQPVSARFYMGRSNSASVVYCSIWVGSREYHTSGHGQAGGYGYCKKRAALYWACKDANLEFSRSTSSTGEIRETLIAIAKALGYRGKFQIV